MDQGVDADGRAYVIIRLADAAPRFVTAALDLLVEVEEADEVLVTDGILARAAELREIVQNGAW